MKKKRRKINLMNQVSKIVDRMKKIPAPVILGCIIVVAVIRLCVIFSHRDGHHVDETWSYGFANSYEYAQVFDGYEAGSLSNFRTWITGETLIDYVSVTEDHRFAFDAVLRNSEYDLSPPLYIILLHFVSSLFPGHFSWGYAFFLSLLSYVPSLILIYLIAVGFSDSKFCGYLSVIYYIFSGCGTANFIFLRVYFLVTFFSLLLFWIILKIIKNDSPSMKFYFLLPVATILGSLTHYYFLVIAFFFTFFGAIALLFGKRIRESFRLCYVMLASVVLFFFIYSPALNILFPYSTGETSSTGYYSYPYYMDLAVANIRFFLGSIGFFINFNVPDLMLFVGSVVFFILIATLFVFLFRNEEWMKKLVINVKKLSSISLNNIVIFFKRFDASIYVAFLSSISYLLVIPYSASIMNMGFTERYFFCAMTVFIIVYSCVVGLLLKTICMLKKNKVISYFIISIISVALILLNIRSNTWTNDFKFLNSNEKVLLNEANGRDCYVVACYNRDLTWLCADLNNSGDIYLNFQEDFTYEDFTVPGLKKGTLVIIVESSLLTEEQKEDMLNNGAFDIAGFSRPGTMLTVNDVVDKISRDTGCSCTRIDECNTFIGMLGLYKLG